MNTKNPYNYRKCFCILIPLFILLFPVLPDLYNLYSTDHSHPVLEPYQLAGKRLVFTNWFYVRPGHYDWVDSTGTSVWTNTQAKLGPDEARYIAVDSPYGVELFVEPARRDIPIIKTDKLWDQWGIRLSTLIYENGKYRLWGNCFSDNLNSGNCYFESEDGENWSKPDLGLIEFNGNRDNNLIAKEVGLSVFVDQQASPEQRYKTMWHSRISQEEFAQYKNRRSWSYYAIELDKPLVHILRGAVSGDGLTWKILEEPLAFEHMDSQTVGYFDTILKKYVLYSRNHMVGSRAFGQPYPAEKFHQRLSRRAIGRTENVSFDRFPLSELIIETDSYMHPAAQFYTNCRTTIPRAPDHHLMFPAIYNVADDETDIVLYASYNGINWHRVPGPAVLKTQTEGQPDGGCVFAHPNLVERPNGDWILPYTGYNVPHKFPRGAYRFEPGMLVWPKGRLTGICADEIGEFATAAIVVPGSTLKINAVTQRAGYIRVEVVNMQGNTVPGHSFSECVDIIGDSFFKTVEWKNSKDLGVKTGEPVILRFKMKMAKIYGLEFE